MSRKINQAGIDLIKRFEGLGDGDKSTPGLDPYLCPASVATIGYGHAIVVDGRQLKNVDGLVRAKTLYPQGITIAEAEDLLRADMIGFERGVAACVKVPLTDNQFASLVSFAFNLGVGALQKSTLLKLLNQGKYSLAANEFLKWNKAAGRILPGLVRRREAERALFLREDGKT